MPNLDNSKEPMTNPMLDKKGREKVTGLHLVKCEYCDWEKEVWWGEVGKTRREHLYRKHRSEVVRAISPQIREVLSQFAKTFAKETSGEWWGHDTDLGSCKKEFDVATQQIIDLLGKEL